MMMTVKQIDVQYSDCTLLTTTVFYKKPFHTL